VPSIFEYLILESSTSPDFPDEPEGSTLRTNYDPVRDVNYNEDDVNGRITYTRNGRVCFKTPEPTFNYLIYLRIRGFLKGALGTPSPATIKYATAKQCGDLMYLCRHCWPPEDGMGAWLVNDTNNINLEDWICQGCPVGGDCRGPKQWHDIYALYGFQRLGREDYDDRLEAFQKCFRSSACLGGRRELPLRETPGTKHAWKTKIRPPIDCCSAVDPLKEDLVACKKDPENFKSLTEYKRGFVGFDPKSRGCTIDLSLVDDLERCHVEAGYRLNCSYTRSGKCRLCRACTKGYW
jgi:hypothetical protein